ncbi:PilT protein-like [Candidatus Sulfopaludibacter sp. SbA4]|nr:PilT protein-like [Candidatus Sulfopaludibacter sp. SbA4]
MTLVDTSIWVDHIRRPDARLIQLMTERSARMHPFVLGELVAGNLPNRPKALRYLESFPQVPAAQESDVHHLLESNHLWAKGLGWVDLHLLAAALISGCNLLTADHAMMAAANRLGIAYPVN